MSRKLLVKSYMTTEVISVKPKMDNIDVINLMKKTGHDGFPVIDEDTKVIGIVTSFDLLLKDWKKHVDEIMSKNVVVANKDMGINDASRVMFRMGISRMPVVDENNKLVGIITNTDIVRSHIERSTPTKVEYFKTTLEQLYGIKIKIKRMKVPTNKLRPTQNKVYADELQGREYELKRGLAEPTIVAHIKDRWILIDGHHRALAALSLGCKEIDSYVLMIEDDITLGIEKTADSLEIHKFEDVHIIDDSQHPLIALTQSIKASQNNNLEENND